MTDIISFLLVAISVLFLWIMVIYHVNVTHGAVDSNGNIVEEPQPQEDLKCIKFNDGRLAIVDTNNCYGGYETISWFLSKGYHIDAIDDDYSDVFMSR